MISRNCVDLYTPYKDQIKKIILIIEVLRAVVIFWDITPCSPLEVKRRFEVTRRLHRQGRRISQARN
jgi:hypothetical protein